ncbi:MAG: sialate O-acetylesterase [Planctomycetota bacterium]
MKIPHALSRLALTALTLAPSAAAELTLPAILRDGVVLPRERSVPLWGSATPGFPVSIRPSWSADAMTVIADRDGRWRADVQTDVAGGPHTIAFASPDGSLEVKDVLFGEVWLCSGQSNMEWTLGGALDAYQQSPAYSAALGAATSPRVRLFEVPKRVSMEPQADCAGSWRACTPASAMGFSAVAYFFARELEAKLDVPIGLVGSYWGGTPVEAWVSAPRIGGFERHKAALEALRTWDASDAAAKAVEASARWWDATLARTPGSERFADAAFDDSAWTEVEVPGHWEGGPLGNIDGVVWHRHVVDVPAGLAGRALALSLGPIDDDELTLWNGARIGATGGWTVDRNYTVPGELVYPGRNVITVAVHDSGGAGGFHGAASAMTARPADGEVPVLSLAGTWRALAVAATGAAYPRPPAISASTPSALFNGMIAPVQPFRFSGVIWYQGESNRYDPVLYRDTFQALIQDWRAGFATPELPFLWAQIAPFGYREGAPGAHRTALLREAQDRALALPHTGQAILTDIGDVDDIHPLNKWTVGKRLARQALARVYGQDLDADGPRYASHEVEGGAVRVRYSHAATGLVASQDALTWFYVAGADRRFVAASARIDGDSVLVSSSEVTAPVAVRFAWSDIAEPNLFDADGLPAAPFRTDDWDDVVIDG